MNRWTQKNVRLQYIRVFSKKSVSQTDKKHPFEYLRELIGLITAGGGIFAVLLYLAGRSYAAGYFEAMGIPNYHVSFSIWEYGEVAWLPLILYPVAMTILSSLLGGILSVIADWTLSFRSRFWNAVKAKITSWSPTFQFPKTSRKTKLWFAITNNAFTILMFIILIIFTLQAVRQFGTWNGKLYVLGSTAQIELVSVAPLALDNNISPVLTSKQGYVYNGFQLLTFNNGKYYLFKEIDQATCKPIKVYVIDAEKLNQVNLLPPVSLADQCPQANVSKAIATPTTISVTP